MNSFKKAAVLYHYPCPDGAFAALAAHLYFSAASLPVAFFPNPVYDPIRVDSLPLDELSDIYLLDFIGASGFVAEVSSEVDSVTILDHHKTALEDISENVPALRNVSEVIDMERSGATIAYGYFIEKLLRTGNSLGNHAGGGEFLPENKVENDLRLFKLIEDGDLWSWKLPHSKAFSSGLADMKIEYNVNVNLSLFDQLMALDPELVISHGIESLARKQKLIDLALDQSYEIALGCGLFGHCLFSSGESELLQPKVNLYGRCPLPDHYEKLVEHERFPVSLLPYNRSRFNPGFPIFLLHHSKIKFSQVVQETVHNI